MKQQQKKNTHTHTHTHWHVDKQANQNKQIKCAIKQHHAKQTQTTLQQADKPTAKQNKYRKQPNKQASQIKQTHKQQACN